MVLVVCVWVVRHQIVISPRAPKRQEPALAITATLHLLITSAPHAAPRTTTCPPYHPAAHAGLLHAHTHTHVHSHSHTLIHTHSFIQSLIHVHALSNALTHTHIFTKHFDTFSHTFIMTHSHTHTNINTYFLSLSHTHTRTHAHTHTRTNTRTHTHTHGLRTCPDTL